jgi:hypothetical protein
VLTSPAAEVIWPRAFSLAAAFDGEFLQLEQLCRRGCGAVKRGDSDFRVWHEPDWRDLSDDVR